MIFEDRVQAGRMLATDLAKYKGSRAVILAIPRGGVVVGFEVAAALNCPLDVVVPRKLGAPMQPELAIGAVTTDAVILNDSIVDYLRVSRDYIDQAVNKERAEIERRQRMYRENRPAPDLDGRTAIIVDDGIATGYTMVAAIADCRKKRAAGIVVAAPVASREAIGMLRAKVDDVVILEVPDDFYAVGAWYANFDQTSDEEVIELLACAAERAPA